jgi:hypothetical protein
MKKYFQFFYRLADELFVHMSKAGSKGIFSWDFNYKLRTAIIFC